MIIDANLLLYAVNADDPRGDAAASWLESVLSAPERVGLPWQSLQAFLRLSTNPRVFPRPLTTDQALDQVEAWLDAPAAWLPVQGPRHAQVLSALLRRHRVRGPLVTDAALAALAVEHGVGVYSADADFGRFRELVWVDPLRER